MEEILLTNKKNGMRTLLLYTFLELLSLVGAIALGVMAEEGMLGNFAMLGIVGAVVDLYVLAGIVIQILAYCKVLKD